MMYVNALRYYMLLFGAIVIATAIVYFYRFLYAFVRFENHRLFISVAPSRRILLVCFLFLFGFIFSNARIVVLLN